MNQDIEDLLVAYDLPSDDEAIADVESDIAVAREISSQANPPLLPKRRAQVLARAATRLLDAAEDFELGVADFELDAVRLIKAKAEFAQLIPGIPGPEPRFWLGGCANGFLMLWRSLASGQSDAVYEGSPALGFVTACCKFIDNTVNESAVLLAVQPYANEVGSTQDNLAAYERWSLSDAAKVSREITELERRLNSRRKTAA